MKPVVFCAALLAGPAMAEELCTGVASGSWVGGSAETSDLTTLADPATVSTIIPVSGSYVGLFSLSDMTEVRLEAKGSFGGDPVAELYDGAGNLIGGDDDSGADYAVHLVQSLAAGNYCLVVRSVEDGLLPAEMQFGRADQEPLTELASGGGSTVVSDDPTCLDADERIGFAVDAPPLTIPVSGNVAVEFEVTEATPLRLRAEALAGDALLSLEDGSGDVLAMNDDHDGYNAQIDMTAPLAPGNYCALVRTYELDGSGVIFSANTLDPADILREQVDRGEISPAPGSDHPVTDLGALNGRLIYEAPLSGTFTWLRFDTQMAGLIMTEALSVGGSDPRLVLFDDAGRSMGANDDIGEGNYSSRIAVPNLPGTYLLGVGSVNDEGGTARIVIDQYMRVE